MGLGFEPRTTHKLMGLCQNRHSLFFYARDELCITGVCEGSIMTCGLGFVLEMVKRRFDRKANPNNNYNVMMPILAKKILIVVHFIM